MCDKYLECVLDVNRNVYETLNEMLDDNYSLVYTKKEIIKEVLKCFNESIQTILTQKNN